MGRTNATLIPPAAFVRPLFPFHDPELAAFQARQARIETLVARIQPALAAAELCFALLALVIVAHPIARAAWAVL